MTVADASPTRLQLLDTYARFYGTERFAVTFTATTEGDDAKRVTTQGWDKTKPLATADQAAGLIGQRGQTRNIAIVLRPSNLIVLECDTEDDLLRIQELGLPITLTVRSSKPYKRHFYFRPPADLEQLPYVAFRFESGKLTADIGRYFLAPPSIHPSGAIYAFLPNLGPDDVDIAELPAHIYRDLARGARVETDQAKVAVEHDPEFRFRAGQRGDALFRYACMLRRWGIPYTRMLTMADDYNQAMCDPPIEHTRVAMQVDGAMKKRGGQELVTKNIPDPEPQPEPETVVGNWHRTDLTDPAYLIPPDPPSIHGLLYAAKRHVLSGPQESAKTLIAYHLLLEAHRAGDPVAIVDFEMGPTAARLLLHDLGATPDELADIYYTEPQGPPTDDDLEAVTKHGTRYALIDAAAGAFDATGLDDNSRKDAEAFARLWIRPLWQRQIATLLLDHVTKDKEARGKYAIGSERKTGGADVHLGFDALKALSRGGNGLVKVMVHKDRPGFLARPTAAMLDLSSAPDTHAISIAIRDPHPTDDQGTFRPTIYMEKISRELEKHQGQPRSRNQLEAAVKGKAQYVRDGLDFLVLDGFVTETIGARGSRMYTTIQPYVKPADDLVPEGGTRSANPDNTHHATSSRAEPHNHAPFDLVPTSSRPRPGRSNDDLVPRPPSTEGDDVGRGQSDEETKTTSSRPIDVHDPAIQRLLDDT